MKRIKIKLELLIGIASLLMSVLSVASMIWIGAFKMAELTREVKDINVRLDKIDIRVDRLEDEFHKMDIRVIKLEAQTKN